MKNRKRLKKPSGSAQPRKNGGNAADPVQMEPGTCTVTIKKSKLHARDHFDYEKLVFPGARLLPAKFHEDLEEVSFVYDTSDKRCAVEMPKETMEHRYQFLQNLFLLADVWREFSFSMDPENLYYDRNFLPFVKNRDLYEDGKRSDMSLFLFLCKTYAGGFLSDRYSVKQLQESGIEVLKGDRKLDPLMQAGTLQDLQRMVAAYRREYEEKERRNHVVVSRKKNSVKTVLSVISPLAAGVLAVGLLYLLLHIVPYQNAVIQANEAFVRLDYVAVMDAMEPYALERMDTSTKYILAVSYARSEDLQKNEIESIVSGLSVNSDVRVLEYWICLGRLDTAQAEDLAQALSDDRLLVYAYMKELDILQTDTTMSGQDKQARVSELEQKITELGKKYSPDKISASDGSSSAGSPADTSAASGGTGAAESQTDTQSQSDSTSSSSSAADGDVVFRVPDADNAENTGE